MEEILEKLKIESQYRKIVSEEAVRKLIKIYSNDTQKQKYKSTISESLKIVKDFYKEYNKEYYLMIKEGIKNNEIILNSNNSKVDIKNNVCYIELKNNDSDLYRIVHEFAHFIDRKSIPHIILDEHSFLCEVFSFYIEKVFEKYLGNSYKEITKLRRKNREYNLNRYSKIIEYEQEYEELYRLNKLKNFNIDNEKLNILKNIKYENVINYYLRYLLGDLLSDYIIEENIIPTTELSKILLEKDLMKIINERLEKSYKE